jgi:hypothetical protein
MMISQNVKEFLEWSKDMDRRVKQVEQEEVESEKFPNSNSQIFVLQREKDILHSELEDAAFKELESRLK